MAPLYRMGGVQKVTTAVCKFGGSSLADAACIARVVALIREPSPARTCKHVVVSAPGKRNADDTKVTDLLIKAHGFAVSRDREQYDVALGRVAARFEQLSSLPTLRSALSESASSIWDVAKAASFSRSPYANAAYAASRGEYLNAMVVAHELGYDFVDPADECIIFESDRATLDLERTIAALRRRVACAGTDGGYVLGGFFGGVRGSNKPADVATFSRGGSDVTASLVAAAIAEEIGGGEGGEMSECHGVVHENFTDVDGVWSADPRLCAKAYRLPRLGYEQTRLLALAGANVLHPDAIAPLVRLKVPIHVRSTWQPRGHGTWIGKEGDVFVPTEVRRDRAEIGLAAEIAPRSRRDDLSVAGGRRCRPRPLGAARGGGGGRHRDRRLQGDGTDARRAGPILHRSLLCAALC